MGILQTIDNFFSYSKKDEFYDFIYELVEKYWISTKNCYWIYKWYDDEIFYIPWTDYSIKVYDWKKIYVYKEQKNIVEYNSCDVLLQEVYNQRSIYNKKQKDIEESKESQKLDKIMIEDRLKYLENIQWTWEFDEVFDDIKEFKNLTERLNTIYNKYKK